MVSSVLFVDVVLEIDIVFVVFEVREWSDVFAHIVHVFGNNCFCGLARFWGFDFVSAVEAEAKAVAMRMMMIRSCAC